MLEVQEIRDHKIKKRGEYTETGQCNSSEPRVEVDYIYYRSFIIA